MAIRSVARLYDSYDVASRVVSELEATGIPHSDLSLVSNNQRTTGTHTAGTTAATTDRTTDAGTGAGAGASIGTILGGGAGLLAGIGSLAIPGVGPVVAAGWLVATLAGAGVGAAAGGLIGSLTGAGVSEQEANVYGEGVRRGGTLVIARVDETQAARVEQVMDQHGPARWQDRAEEYRQGGWTGFDPNAAPYTGGTRTPAGSAAATDPDATRLGSSGPL